MNVEKKIHAEYKKSSVNVVELKGGSRRKPISEMRARLVMELIRDYGLTLAEPARQLGVSTSAVSQIIRRNIQQT